jgi:hypothetical protein
MTSGLALLIFCQAEFAPRRLGTNSISSCFRNRSNTFFTEFSDLFPVTILASVLVIEAWLSRYFKTISSGEASGS